MHPTSLLSGKVLRHTLPVFDPPAGREAVGLKRLRLPQGDLAQIHDADEPIRYIAVIELRTDSVRGNHYHRAKLEFVYLIEGEVSLLVENIETRQREALTLQAGDLVRIEPGIAHALQTVRAGQAIEFSPARYDPADTHRYPLA